MHPVMTGGNNKRDNWEIYFFSYHSQNLAAAHNEIHYRIHILNLLGHTNTLCFINPLFLHYRYQTFCKCMNMQNYIVKWVENDGHQFCLSWVQNNTIIGAHYSGGNDPHINKITRDQILSLRRRLLVYFCLVSKSSYVNKLLLYRVYQGCEDVNMHYFITKSPFMCCWSIQ